MWALDVEEMEPSSKINLRDVSWWMSTKDACKHKAPITTNFSKEGCISLTKIKRSSYVTHKHE
jgi:hypothetical protein